ncbi:MAG: hypothetical protein K2W96_14585 [Gemmataceae bacterium]|nr:hypothetical protein [Gemmataceae bacterium]
MLDQRTARTRLAGQPKRITLEARLHHVVEQGPAAIDERLIDLENEWSAGRATKVALALVIGAGLLLTFLVSPWFAVLPALGAFCLVQYLYRRPCLMSQVVRRMGFRPMSEIDQERLALKALRGDFKHLPTMHQVEDHDAISRFEDEGGPAIDREDRVSPREAVKEILTATKH